MDSIVCTVFISVVTDILYVFSVCINSTVIAHAYILLFELMPYYHMVSEVAVDFRL